MRKLSWASLLAIVVVSAAAATVQAQAAWQEYANTKWGFTVQVPGTPKEQKQQIPTESGPVDASFYSVESGADSGFMIVVGDLPNADKEPAQDVLARVRDGAVSSANGKLVSDKAITVGAWPGREYVAEATDGTNKFHVVARIVLAKKRLYQVMSLAPKGKQKDADNRKYLDSFKVTVK
jgi:hypothetical protein